MLNIIMGLSGYRLKDMLKRTGQWECGLRFGEVRLIQEGLLMCGVLALGVRRTISFGHVAMEMS